MRRVLRPMRPDEVDSVVTVQQEAAVAAFGHIFPQDAHPFPRAEVQQRWAYELSRSDVQCFVVEGARLGADRPEPTIRLPTPSDPPGLRARPHRAVSALQWCYRRTGARDDV